MIGKMDADRRPWTSMIGLRDPVPGKTLERDLYRTIHTITEYR